MHLTQSNTLLKSHKIIINVYVSYTLYIIGEG